MPKTFNQYKSAPNMIGH